MAASESAGQCTRYWDDDKSSQDSSTIGRKDFVATARLIPESNDLYIELQIVPPLHSFLSLKILKSTCPSWEQRKKKKEKFSEKNM